MTKNFIFSIAAMAIMLVSCSQNEVDVQIPTADAISLSPSTAVTRATINDLDVLKGSNDGFVVYATSGTPTGWYSGIDGTNNHKYDGSKWGFNPGIKWPEIGKTPSNYPMHFYAYYPQAADNAAITSVSDNYTDLKLNVTIPSAVSDQVDILATHGETNTKPATASLVMTFKHILSKIFFTVTISNPGQKASILALGFENLYTTNSFNMISQTWGSFTTGAHRDSLNYYNSFIQLEGDNRYTAKDFAGFDPLFYGNTDKEFYMMLLPQEQTNWDISNKPVLSIPVDDPYVKILYRLETAENKNYIGYEHASDHPDYKGSELEIANYDGPLFVLAGYSYETKWEPGKGYQYNIPMPGNGGGILLDTSLYDDQGKPSDLTYSGGEAGENVITSDEYIHLIPKVIEWEDDFDSGVYDE